MSAPFVCACGRVSTIKKRGLCNTCYQRAWHQGRLAEHERVNWSRDDLLAEWRFLAEQGVTVRQAAERLGVSYYHLKYTVERSEVVV